MQNIKATHEFPHATGPLTLDTRDDRHDFVFNHEFRGFWLGVHNIDIRVLVREGGLDIDMMARDIDGVGDIADGSEKVLRVSFDERREVIEREYGSVSDEPLKPVTGEDKRRFQEDEEALSEGCGVLLRTEDEDYEFNAGESYFYVGFKYCDLVVNRDGQGVNLKVAARSPDGLQPGSEGSELTLSWSFEGAGAAVRRWRSNA